MGGGMSLPLPNSRSNNDDWNTRLVYTEFV
jgi:hypothetical protein